MILACPINGISTRSEDTESSFSLTYRAIDLNSLTFFGIFATLKSIPGKGVNMNFMELSRGLPEVGDRYGARRKRLAILNDIGANSVDTVLEPASVPHPDQTRILDGVKTQILYDLERV